MKVLTLTECAAVLRRGLTRGGLPVAAAPAAAGRGGGGGGGGTGVAASPLPATGRPFIAGCRGGHPRRRCQQARRERGGDALPFHSPLIPRSFPGRPLVHARAGRSRRGLSDAHPGAEMAGESVAAYGGGRVHRAAPVARPTLPPTAPGSRPAHPNPEATGTEKGPVTTHAWSEAAGGHSWASAQFGVWVKALSSASRPRPPPQRRGSADQGRGAQRGGGHPRG